MRRFIAALAALGLIATMSIVRGVTATHDLSASSTEALISSLVSIHAPAPGLSGAGRYSIFIVDDESPRLETGLLGVPAPAVPAEMRELVRRGLAALPILIQHLDDTRTTKLAIGGERFFLFRELGDEYDPRARRSLSLPPPPCDAACFDKRARETRWLKGAYRVKIGDVCFVLIGQIVGRHLNAARYQPTAGLIVNSPIETPSLRDQISADWANLDAQAHEASLLADLKERESFRFEPALPRLRFYYPNTYAALSGEDAKRRDAFEAEEQKERAAR